jgi:MFS family permease
MTLWSRLRLPEVFDRDLKLLLCSMATRRVAMGFLGVVRAIYFALLGLSPIEIGVLLSLATLTLRMVIFATSTDFWMLALGQGVGAMGEGAGAGQPVVSGYIADKTSSERRSSIFSTLAVTNGIAATVGSLMAGLPTYFQTALTLDVVAAHALLFWISAVGGVASILLVLPLTDVRATRPTDATASCDAKPTHSWGVIARFSLVRSTSGVGWGLIESLLSLYFFVQFAVGGEVLGPVFAGARALSVFSYVLVPPVVTRLGEIHTLMASRLAAAGFAVLFALAPSFPVALSLMVAFRVVMMFSMPVRQTFATGIVDPRETSTAIGVSNFARMGLRTVAPTLAGYMFETISLTMPFLTGASLLVVNAMLYKVFWKS